MISILAIVALNSCTNPVQQGPVANLPPKSFLWLYPDSIISEGPSKQHVHWWGDDPDGVVQGYLYAAGKLPMSVLSGVFPDTLEWRWRLGNDTNAAFQLRTKRDTFMVIVRAVDNTFLSGSRLPDQALI
ncbi:MAG TPA: hypothetical protein VKS81_03960, partial [Bacteroidota bacterium]|nr:hypothetical protein [Bacteroidota bacterium]